MNSAVMNRVVIVKNRVMMNRVMVMNKVMKVEEGLIIGLFLIVCEDKCYSQ